MMSIEPGLKETLTPAMRMQAAAWLARLHGPERTAQAERGFRRWLESDPDHARAFELVTEVWDRAGSVRRPLSVQPASRWIPAGAAVAAMILLSIAGTFLYMRDPAVSTMVGEQRILTLEDGTRIYLNTATRAEVQYDSQVRRVALEEGEALFEVAQETARPFVVVAGNREVTALGTAFIVRREDHRMTVTLMEGQVRVSSASHEPTLLNPGERLTFLDEKAPELDAPAMDKVVAWRNGQVALDDTPLAEAVAEMNRYSHTRLAVQSEQAARLRISGIFRAGDSANFARAVAATYQLELREHPDGIVLTGVPGAPRELPLPPAAGEVSREAACLYLRSNPSR